MCARTLSTKNRRKCLDEKSTITTIQQASDLKVPPHLVPKMKRNLIRWKSMTKETEKASLKKSRPPCCDSLKRENYPTNSGKGISLRNSGAEYNVLIFENEKWELDGIELKISRNLDVNVCSFYISFHTDKIKITR